LVTAAFTGCVPEAVVALQPHSAKAEEARKVKFRAEDKDAVGAMDCQDMALAFVGRMCPTTKTYAQMRQRQEEDKAQEELDKAEHAKAKAEGQEKREAEEKERKVKREVTLAERAAKKASKDAETATRMAAKAARVAGKVAKSVKGSPIAAAAPQAGKRAKQAEKKMHGRVYKKHKR
jgi:hypothetical protein